MARTTVRKVLINISHIAALALVLMAGSLLWAHGGEKHVMGTVQSTTADSIAVKTANGATVTVTVNAQTKFIRDGSLSSAADLKTGDRVVIHAKEEQGKLVATEVKSGGKTAPAVKKK